MMDRLEYYGIVLLFLLLHIESFGPADFVTFFNPSTWYCPVRMKDNVKMGPKFCGRI